MTYFMGADRVARAGAAGSGRPGAMRASGKRRNAAQILNRVAPIRPTRRAGRFWPPAAPTRRLLSQHNGATRALRAAMMLHLTRDLWSSSLRVGQNSMTFGHELVFARHTWQNGDVERLNGSIRRECLDHIIIWNERHLRHVLRDYLAYYHMGRTHLGLGKNPPLGRPVSNRTAATRLIIALPRLGGLHHRYEWAEAA